MNQEAYHSRTSKRFLAFPPAQVCSAEGCHHKVKAKGLCSTHYKKPCSIDGCTSKAQVRGRCAKHGAALNPAAPLTEAAVQAKVAAQRAAIAKAMAKEKVTKAAEAAETAAASAAAKTADIFERYERPQRQAANSNAMMSTAVASTIGAPPHASSDADSSGKQMPGPQPSHRKGSSLLETIPKSTAKVKVPLQLSGDASAHNHLQSAATAATHADAGMSVAALLGVAGVTLTVDKSELKRGPSGRPKVRGPYKKKTDDEKAARAIERIRVKALKAALAVPPEAPPGAPGPPRAAQSGCLNSETKEAGANESAAASAADENASLNALPAAQPAPDAMQAKAAQPGPKLKNGSLPGIRLKIGSPPGLKIKIGSAEQQQGLRLKIRSPTVVSAAADKNSNGAPQ